MVKGATIVILLLLISICLSNLLSTYISLIFAHLVYTIQNNTTSFQTITEAGSQLGLVPMWETRLPSMIENKHAMILGLLLGIASKFFPVLRGTVTSSLNKLSNSLLIIIKAIILPFVLGFLIKMQHDKSMAILAERYGLIFLVVAFAQFSYIPLMYYIASGMNGKKWCRMLRNMMPPAMTGLSTMSSASAMPLTISAVKQNAELIDTESTDASNVTKNEEKTSITASLNLVSSVVPATVNVHLIGDCLAIPIFAYAVLKAYGTPEPGIYQYAIFALYFIIAKFSVAAIPGGGIIVMLPILHDYLGFSGDMMSIITTLYILFDPVITCANVLGNGCFALLFMKLCRMRLSHGETRSEIT